MKKRKSNWLKVVALTTALMLGVGASAKGWDAVKTEKPQAKHVVSDSELEIKAGGGLIIVTTSKNINIKIFTILGSRISDETLPAGSYQFTVPTHGVYIIKAGDITCKVAV